MYVIVQYEYRTQHVSELGLGCFGIVPSFLCASQIVPTQSPVPQRRRLVGSGFLFSSTESAINGAKAGGESSDACGASNGNYNMRNHDNLLRLSRE
jgi:hypothetical protein